MEKDIGRIKKNEFTELVVRIDDFGGKKGVTIREFVTGDRYTGFTKSGTRISPENFLSFREIINSINLEDLKEQNADEEQETLDDSSGGEGEKKGDGGGGVGKKKSTEEEGGEI